MSMLDSLAEYFGVNLALEEHSRGFSVWAQIPETGELKLVGTGTSEEEALDEARNKLETLP